MWIWSICKTYKTISHSFCESFHMHTTLASFRSYVDEKSPDNGLWTFSWVCILHMKNAAGPSLEETGYNKSIPMQRSHVCVCSTSTPALFTKSSWISLSFQVDIFVGVFYLNGFPSSSFFPILRPSLVVNLGGGDKFHTGSFGHSSREVSWNSLESLTLPFVFLHTAPSNNFRRYPGFSASLKAALGISLDFNLQQSPRWTS